MVKEKRLAFVSYIYQRRVIDTRRLSLLLRNTGTFIFCISLCGIIRINSFNMANEENTIFQKGSKTI